MPTRDQLTAERLDALIDLLVAVEAIDQEQADAVRSARDFGEAAEQVQANIPDHALERRSK